MAVLWLDQRGLCGPGSAQLRACAAGPPTALGDGERGGPVDADKETELALCSRHLGEVDLEDDNRVALQRPALWRVASDIRQARDAMAVQAPSQR